MNRKIFWRVFIAASSVFIFGCSGSNSINGTVYDLEGNPAGGVAIRFIAVSDRGEELSTFGSTLANSSGHFSFSVPASPANNFIAEANLETGKLRGFAYGNHKTIIHPLSEALVEEVFHITGPTGGISLSDISMKQLQTALDAVIKLDSSAIDFSDTSATHEFLLSNEGRNIAKAFESTLTTTPSSDLDPVGTSAAASFSVVAPCGITDVQTLASSSFTFDITPDGGVCTGYTASAVAAFAYGYRLRVFSDTFSFNSQNEFPVDEASATVQDNRTIVLGPFATTGGLTVTRKIYIPETGNIARFLEIIKNPTAQTRNISFQIYGGLATSVGTVLAEIGEGSDTISSTDRFVATAGNFIFNPTVGHIWQDSNGVSAENIQFVSTGDPSSFGWQFTGVSLAPAQEKTFLSYTFLTTERDSSILRLKLTDLVEQPNMDEMYSDELNGLQNFAPSRGNICASSGSVVPGSKITITNTQTGLVVATRARSDWGYCAALSAVSGDSITIEASDGYNQTTTVP